MATRLFWQLFPSYLLAAVGVLALVALQAVPALREFHQKQVFDSLEAEAKIFAELAEIFLPNSTSPDPDKTEIERIAKRLGKSTVTRLSVIATSGKVVADSQEMPSRMDNHAARPEVAAALTRREVGREIRYSATIGQDFCYVAVPIMRGDDVVGAVRASMPMNDVEEALSGLLRRIAVGGTVAAVLIVALSWFLARRISRPLELMTVGAERFAKGELDHRLPVKGCREIETLAAALGAMAGQLQERIDTITQQRNRHQAILSSMAEGVLALDTASKIITIN